MLVLLSIQTHAEDKLSATQKDSVEQIIQAFKTQDTVKISHMIEYPLKRDIPLPAIQNAKEMQARFTQVFDKNLHTKISNSTPNDWSHVGWRGIMFDRGDVWITNVDDDENQNVVAKIFSVNYSSTVEQQLIKTNILAQKKHLHASLRQFESPALLFKTADYLVRIDLLKTDQYRYAAWKGHTDQSKKPDLILNNGSLEVLGTIRDQQYQFKSGPYTYEALYSHFRGDTDNDVTLTVSKGEYTLLQQEGSVINY